MKWPKTLKGGFLCPGDRWSSYKRYALGQKDDIITELNPLYMHLAGNDAERRWIYKEYVNEERPYELLVDKGLGIE